MQEDTARSLWIGWGIGFVMLGLGKKRPPIPFEIDTDPNFLADPPHQQRILEQLGMYSDSGQVIKFQYP